MNISTIALIVISILLILVAYQHSILMKTNVILKDMLQNALDKSKSTLDDDIVIEVHAKVTGNYTGFKEKEFIIQSCQPPSDGLYDQILEIVQLSYHNDSILAANKILYYQVEIAIKIKDILFGENNKFPVKKFSCELEKFSESRFKHQSSMNSKAV